MKKTLFMTAAILSALALTGCKTEKKILTQATIVAEPKATIQEIGSPITYTNPKRAAEEKTEDILAEVAEPEVKTPVEEIKVAEPEPAPVVKEEPKPVVIEEPVKVEPVKVEPVKEEPAPAIQFTQPKKAEEVVEIEPMPTPAAPVTPVEPVAPVTKEKPVVHKGDRQEKVTLVNDADANLLRNYNVVVGSFGSKVNAENMKKKMVGRGYNSFLIQNEKGMYRVIAGGYDSHSDALDVRDDIRSTYSTESGTCAEVWLLVPAM